MENVKRPGSLPTELWIKIFAENQPNPVELLFLSQIKKVENHAACLASLDIGTTNKPRPARENTQAGANNRFFDSFEKAASDDSLMRRYSQDPQDGTHLLAAFHKRLKTKEQTTKNKIVENYLSKRTKDFGLESAYGLQETDDFDLVMSYAVVAPAKIWLKDAPMWVRSNKKIILTSLKADGFALRWASEGLRNDKEIVLAAVAQSGQALMHASEKIKNNREVMLAAVENNVFALCHASEKFRDDKEILLVAAKKSGDALMYASTKMRNDKEVVLAAISNNAFSLSYAGPAAKNNKEVIMTAVRIEGLALLFASIDLKNDKQVVLAAVENDGLALDHADTRLKDDREVVMAAMVTNIVAYRYASPRLKKDKRIRQIVQKGEEKECRRNEMTSSCLM